METITADRASFQGWAEGFHDRGHGSCRERELHNGWVDDGVIVAS